MGRGPSRREVLAGLGALALAGCGGDEGTPTPAQPRVAVIGGGLAGVSTAWLLEGWPVDLFEARADLGGNVRTFVADVRGEAVPIDMGAQYFNARVYPTYDRLLARLGVVDPENPSESKIFVAPSSVTITGAGADPLFVSPVVPSRLWPVTEPWNRDAVAAFQALAEGARTLDQEDADWQLTIEDWLPTLGLSEAQRDGILLPWLAAINTNVMATARQFSARAGTIFVGRALGAEGRLDSTTYATLQAGMGAVVDRMAAETLDLTVISGQPVVAVERTSAGLLVRTAEKRRGPYTAVVLALQGPLGARLLSGLTGLDATRSALSEIEIFEATLALHRDPIYVPADPRYHSLINAQVAETTCEVSMSMAEALAPRADGSRVDLWKSWIGHRDRQPTDVLTTETYTHTQYSPATLRAQDKLAALQGEGGLYFAGGWTQRFDAQETALLSAMAVAEALAPESARLAALKV